MVGAASRSGRSDSRRLASGVTSNSQSSSSGDESVLGCISSSVPLLNGEGMGAKVTEGTIIFGPVTAGVAIETWW